MLLFYFQANSENFFCFVTEGTAVIFPKKNGDGLVSNVNNRVSSGSGGIKQNLIQQLKKIDRSPGINKDSTGNNSGGSIGVSTSEST